MSIRTHAMMMIRFPFKLACINCLALLVLFVVVFILLDVLMNEFVSFKLSCYDKYFLLPLMTYIEGTFGITSLEKRVADCLAAAEGLHGGAC